MAKININNLTFGFGDNTLFENLSLSLDSSWKLGLIGKNGRGKTTLLQLICGKHEYSGSITSTLSFEYFPYDIEDPDLMVIDAFTELKPSLEQWKLCRELSLLNMDEGLLYMPFSSLSPGQQTKLQIALMFSTDDNFLLIDEPTNHLDIEGRQAIANYLMGKQGYIVISHDRSFLDTCIDHVLAINKKTITLHKGNYSSWQREFDSIQQSEIEHNRQLKGEINRLAKSMQDKQQWSDSLESTKKGTRIGGLRPDTGHIGHKSAKLAKRSKVLSNRMKKDIEKKSALLKDYETSPPISISHENCPYKRLVTINDLSFAYGDKTVFNGFKMSMDKDERIALFGSNGCGKSTLLNLICGNLTPTEGTITKPKALRISYLSQNSTFLKGSLNDYIVREGCDPTLFKTILRKLGFDRSTFDVPLHKMSMGQRKKIAITASLCQKAHLYLWDEPINYLDLSARIQLEQLILECKPSLIFVEHDKTFVENTATRVITL